MLSQQQRETFDAVIAAKQAIIEAKEIVRWIPDSTIAMPVMEALANQIDQLEREQEELRKLAVTPQ